MKVVFVRFPVALWPYHPSVYPLSLFYLTAALQEYKNCEVKIIDCQLKKIGWKTLEKELAQEKPDVVCISINSATIAQEGGRLALLTKKINPQAIIIAGGVHVSATAEESLNNYAFDIIVCGEGEITICELIRELDNSSPRLEKVQGIAFKKGTRIIQTEPRPLIENLDDLPDLSKTYASMNLRAYKKDVQYGDATIQASRGCSQKCTFCACWPHFSERTLSQKSLNEIIPRLRFRSVKSVLKEMQALYYQHHKRHFFFIDDCFNTYPQWQEELAEAIIESKMKIRFTALMRIDFIKRDYSNGVFDKLAKAGLCLVICGIERANDEELNCFGRNMHISDIKSGFEILHKYPQIIKLAVSIVGMKHDTLNSIRKLGKFIIQELRPDFCSFQALTPLPGTLLWEGIQDKYPQEHFDFSKFHWSNAVLPTDSLSKEQVRAEITKLQIIQATQWRRILKMLIGRYSYQRKFYRYIYWGSFRVAWYLIKSNRNLISEHYYDIMKPAWYEK